MTGYEPSITFHNAAAYLSSSSPSLRRVSSSVKLELYGLFKYLTSSRSPTSSRPSLFDMTGRAKWDAWDAAGKRYERPEDVEQRYLEIARSVGWTEMFTTVNSPETTQEVKSKASEDPEDIDWDDEASASSKSSSGGGGMGLFVSTMAQPLEEVTDKSVHGLAISNDVAGLTALLDASSDLDLNALDEYGFAPIHLACDRGNIEVVKLLLVRGADRNVKDPDGLSPLELSQEAGRTDIANILEFNP